jgi:hypothetical protein
MTTASLNLAGYTRSIVPLLILAGLAVDLLARRAHPGGLFGLSAGAVILLSNWPLVALGNRIVWYPEVLARAVLPSLALAASTGSLGAWVAGSLNSQSGRSPCGAASRTHEDVHP